MLWMLQLWKMGMSELWPIRPAMQYSLGLKVMSLNLTSLWMAWGATIVFNLHIQLLVILIQRIL